MHYPRNALPEAIYHVMSRGNRKQDIFLSSLDREIFIHLVETAVTDFSWKCHSYCIMTNHYHLLIETTTGGLSDGMHMINSGYSGAFNKRYQKNGHVFQGRFRSRLIKDDADFLTVVRYMALNPVKAGLAVDPVGWKWSSYGALAGNRSNAGFLDVDLVRSFFASPGNDGNDGYRAFIAERIPDALAGNLGHLPTLIELFASCTDAESKKCSMSEAHFDFGYTMSDIADFLGVSCSAVSRAIKSFHSR